MKIEALRRFVYEDAGQDVIEYALLAASVGIAGYLVMEGISNGVFTTYASWLDPAAGTPSVWEPPEPTAP
jgi:Flp pilus assembly pilin Flp